MAAERDGPQLVTPPEVLYRVGYTKDVSQYTPWLYQKGEARWDDPLIAEVRRRVAASLGVDKSNEDDERVDDEFMRTIDLIPERHRPFRVLYTATTRCAAFVEALQEFRPISKSRSTDARDRLEQVAQDEKRWAREDTRRVGTGGVPLAHLNKLFVGDLAIESCQFADIEHVRSVQYVRLPLLGEARRHDFSDVNRGAILSEVRPFTQALSAWLYFDFDAQPLAGVRYGSTLGQPHENWAVFETVGLKPTTPRAVVRRGAESGRPVLYERELHDALRDLGARIED